jgi:stringent starvation protein B
MIDDSSPSSTRPYLIRALYEWCTDNGFTPYLAVSVDDSVQVPREYVKDGAIVLNISFDATSSLTLGNEYIEFKGRFSGVAREILVPVGHVTAIYARENGQGMAFPLEAPSVPKTKTASTTRHLHVERNDMAPMAEVKSPQLAVVESERRSTDSSEDPDPTRPVAAGTRPALKRVK